MDTSRRIILFCHDPSALPFLAANPAIQRCLSRVELTLIGHVHSRLVFHTGELLSGFPRVAFLGKSIHRITSALNEASTWRQFRTRLCPALAGLRAWRRGGFLKLKLDMDGLVPPRLHWIPLPAQLPS